MEKERIDINPTEWPKAGDIFLKYLNADEKTNDEIFNSLELGELPYAPPVRPGDLLESGNYFLEEGLVLKRKKPIIVFGEEKQANFWRLTIQGAKVAYENDLITEIDLMRVIHLREQEPVDPLPELPSD